MSDEFETTQAEETEAKKPVRRQKVEGEITIQFESGREETFATPFIARRWLRQAGLTVKSAEKSDDGHTWYFDADAEAIAEATMAEKEAKAAEKEARKAAQAEAKKKAEEAAERAAAAKAQEEEEEVDEEDYDEDEDYDLFDEDEEEDEFEEDDF